MKPKRDKVLVVILVCATTISTAQAVLSLSDYWDANNQTDFTMAVLFAISALFYVCILIRHLVFTSYPFLGCMGQARNSKGMRPLMRSFCGGRPKRALYVRLKWT